MIHLFPGFKILGYQYTIPTGFFNVMPAQGIPLHSSSLRRQGSMLF